MQVDMSIHTHRSLTEDFLHEVSRGSALFSEKLRITSARHPILFDELAGQLLSWYQLLYPGDSWEKLVKGYRHFTAEVSRSQMIYERSGAYPHSSYQEVFEKVYNNNDYMDLYHWGVYVSTFAWEHHLLLYQFFKEYFLKSLPEQPLHGLDLGSGSGVWSLLSCVHRPDVSMIGIDISERSVSLATSLIKNTNYANQIAIQRDDALTFKGTKSYDFGISCFLFEHLEDPGQLLRNLSENIRPGGYAFLTAALTASEIDHIYEVTRESEVVVLAEDAGFRLVAALSSAPQDYPRKFTYLPRSCGFVFQKRFGEIW